MLEELIELKRRLEVQKVRMFAEFKRDREVSEKTLADQIAKREEKLKELQVLHDGDVSLLKDRYTRQILELERKLETLQIKHDDTSS